MVLFIAQIIFWISLFLLLYSYGLYPTVLSLCAKLFGNPAKTDDNSLPTIAFVVPAYNEQAVIARKIENILSLDYPQDKIEIWVGSDCSTDSTHDIVLNFGDPRVHLWIADSRGGKTQVINKLAPSLQTQVLIFTDANTVHRPDSIRKMMRYYADPHVGGVAGHIEHRFTNKEIEEVLYRSFESRQKVMESQLHSTISAFGGFYSVRKEVFRPIAYNAYSNDDVLIPMNTIRQGYRMIFAVEAVSEENTTENLKHEFKRRVRIGAGNFQAFFWLLDFLNPARGWPCFCYVSHKATRWFSPWFMLGALLSSFASVILKGPVVYGVLFFCGCAGIAAALSYRVIKLPLLRPLYYFLIMNTALIFGFFRYLGGIKTAAWSHTERSANEVA